jgi:hypothetical protein
MLAHADSKSFEFVITALNKCSDHHGPPIIRSGRIEDFLPLVFQFKSLEQVGGTDLNTNLDVQDSSSSRNQLQEIPSPSKHYEQKDLCK